MGENRPTEYVLCPRCDVPLHYAGTRRFHEGTRFWDFMGGIFELLKNREAFDTYVCSRCGRVEFFVDGIGEELRGEGVAERNILLEPPAPEGATSDEQWRCPSCGLRVPGSFEVCWNCKATREPRPSEE